MTSPVNFNSAQMIIKQAYINAGLIAAEGQEPSSEQLATGMNRLNALINLIQTQGLKLWTNTDLSVGLVAGQNLYTFGPSAGISMTRPLRAPMGYYLDSNGNRRPLDLISRQEWNTLSTVSQQGALVSYFVDKQQTSLNVYVWLTPDSTAATGTLHLILQQQISNAVGMLDTINFPVEWTQYLWWALGDQLSVGQPDSIVARCKGEAESARLMLEGWDVEDAQTFFTPDSRGIYANRGFC